MTTVRAFAAGIPGVHSDQWYPRNARFVLDEVPELGECPGMQNHPLPAPNRDPLADMAQFFNCDSALSACGASNDLLGNHVVGIGRESLFAAGEFSELTTCAPRPLLLEFCSELSVTITNPFDCASAVTVAVRVSRYLSDPHVDSKPIINLSQRRLLNIAGDSQIPLPAVIDQIRFALAILDLLGLPLACNERDSLAASQGPDIDRGVAAEAQDAVVIGDRSSLTESSLYLLVDLVRVSNLGEHTHRELSTQAEFLPGFMVERLLQGEVGEDFDLPSLGAQPVSALVDPTQSREQEFALLFSREQLNFCCNLQ